MEFELAKKVDLDREIDKKQDKLTAGDNITIDPVTNTISGTAQYDDTRIKTDVAKKQDKLVAGVNVQIDDATNTISATDTTYSNATTSSTGLMSSSDKSKLNGIEAGATKNSAGTNISISSTGEISATDTITTINGKTGAITKADITALGIPSQDTIYKKPSSEPISYIQGLQAELDSKVGSYGTNPVLNIAVIDAGGSTTGIPNNTLILELE